MTSLRYETASRVRRNSVVLPAAGSTDRPTACECEKTRRRTTTCARHATASSCHVRSSLRAKRPSAPKSDRARYVCDTTLAAAADMIIIAADVTYTRIPPDSRVYTNIVSCVAVRKSCSTESTGRRAEIVNGFLFSRGLGRKWVYGSASRRARLCVCVRNRARRTRETKRVAEESHDE